VKFGGELKKFLHSPSETPLKGVKVGILVEGFPSELTDSNVAAASRSAISKLAELGAEVKDISIPFYKDSGLIWMVGIELWYVSSAYFPPPFPGCSRSYKKLLALKFQYQNTHYFHCSRDILVYEC
jgi:Asp-tRNA(Asn)/Glu-tRNA(Gln) amidotransferase A subunit family amidase